MIPLGVLTAATAARPPQIIPLDLAYEVTTAQNVIVSIPAILPAALSIYEIPGIADSGTAGVDAALAGDPMSSTEEGLVVGSTGASYYIQGTSARVEVPANDPAHTLAELSIAFYVQPNADGERPRFFGVGNFTTIGDLALGKWTNDQFTGWVAPAPSSSVGWGPGGSTLLTPSTGLLTAANGARLIVVTMGPAGCKLYIDHVYEGVVAAHTIGWNNATAKILGSDPAFPLDGVVDNLSIWDTQLTDAQVALIPSAKTITINGPPVGGVSQLSNYPLDDSGSPFNDTLGA